MDRFVDRAGAAPGAGSSAAFCSSIRGGSCPRRRTRPAGRVGGALAGIPATVELRNHLWFNSPQSTGWTLDMLRDLGLAT